MRCSAWSSLACSVCSVLVLAGSAGAHVDASPTFVPSGGIEVISLTVHNDRAIVMTGFAISAPAGLRFHGVDELDGWQGSAESATAEWTDGSLAPDTPATFGLHVEATAEPGPTTLEVEQGYPDGEVVRWPVTLTIVPADGSDSPSYVWLVVVTAGLLTLAGAAIAWRRRVG